MKTRLLQLSLVLALLGMLGYSLISNVQATNITVTTFADEAGTGPDCSLREAIISANTDDGAFGGCPSGNGADVIILPAGTYSLTLSTVSTDTSFVGDLDITDDLTITGAGVSDTIIDANGIDRVLHILTGDTEIVGVTIKNGDTFQGGGVFVASDTTLTLRESRISENSSSGDGGGVYNNGTVQLINSQIDNNASTGNSDSGDGGGIFNTGFLSVTNTTISNNRSNIGAGGGILNSGVMLIEGGVINGNSAFEGGGLSVTGNTTLSNALISENEATSTDGGGIHADSDDFTLSDTLVINNRAGEEGGGIYVQGGNLTLNNVTLGNNSSSETGGGLSAAVETILTINNSNIISNTSHIGGGISAIGDLTITNTTISDNIASEWGGGVFNSGALTLNSSSVINNIAEDSSQGGATGGGIYNLDTLIINDSAISNNSAHDSTPNYGRGGGIFSSGTLTINSSIIGNNSVIDENTQAKDFSSDVGGGGIFNTGTASLNNSQIERNIVSSFGFTQIIVGAPSADNGVPSFGGGIYNRGNLTLSNSTVSHNRADNNGVNLERGGGIFNDANLVLINVTVSNNIANDGSAIDISNNTASSTDVTNSTVNSNTVNGIGNPGQSFVILQNTIIANHVTNCSGIINSGGHNLSDDDSCSFDNDGDLQNTNPLLGPLQNNGGETETHALLAGSPAIDAGDNQLCPATDQRGEPRPQGQSCDIGAFEALALPDLDIEEFDGPFTARPGEEIGGQTQLIVANTGNIDVPTFEIDVALFADAVTGESHLLETYTLPGGIPAGGSTTVDLAGLTIPADWPEGEFDVDVFIDPTDTIAEANEENNSFFFPINIAQEFSPDPIPEIISKPEDIEVLAVLVNFTREDTGVILIDLEDAAIFPSFPPARRGDPPLIRVQLLGEGENEVLHEFDTWNPLWTFITDETGTPEQIILPQATGRFVFPFDPSYKRLRVFDLIEGQFAEGEIDLEEVLLLHCDQNPESASCQDIIPSPVPASCAPGIIGQVDVGNTPRGLAIDSLRNRVYVANFDSDTISAASTNLNRTITTIPDIPAPNGLTYDPIQNIIWVTNYNTNQITPIQVNEEATSFRVLPAIDVGAGPWGVVHDPVHNYIYVANNLANSITIIDAASQSIVTTLTNSFNQPFHLATNGITGKVYIANFGNNSVTVLNGTEISTVVQLWDSGRVYGIAVDQSRDLVYVATIHTNRIVAIGTLNGIPDQFLGWAAFHRGFGDPNRPVPLRAIGINPGVGPNGDGGHIWTTTSTVDGSEANQILLVPKGWSSRFHLPIPENVGANPAEGLAIDPVNNRIYVTSGTNPGRVTIFSDNDEFCFFKIASAVGDNGVNDITYEFFINDTTPITTTPPTPSPESDQVVLTIEGPITVAPSEIFSVTIQAQEVITPGLYGVQLELDYDPGLISVNNLQINPDLTYVLQGHADNDQGKISLVASRQGQVSGLSGNVSLFTFQATAGITPGQVTFSFNNTKIGDPSASPLELIAQDHILSISSTSTPEPTVEPTNTPEPTDTPEPIVDPTATPQPDITPQPTTTSEPTNIVIIEPTVEPTSTPQPTSSAEPTVEPTNTPELTDTPEPTVEPVATILGQVILAGRINNDWSGASVTTDDSGQNATTNTDGNFTLINVAAGPHTSITANAQGYLPAICTNPVITVPSTTLLSVRLLSGDINNDNIVDITDAVAIGNSFNMTDPDLPADLNRDQVVDIFDIILVSINHLAQGPQPWTCLTP